MKVCQFKVRQVKKFSSGITQCLGVGGTSFYYVLVKNDEPFCVWNRQFKNGLWKHWNSAVVLAIIGHDVACLQNDEVIFQFCRLRAFSFYCRISKLKKWELYEFRNQAVPWGYTEWRLNFKLTNFKLSSLDICQVLTYARTFWYCRAEHSTSTLYLKMAKLFCHFVTSDEKHL